MFWTTLTLFIASNTPAVVTFSGFLLCFLEWLQNLSLISAKKVKETAASTVEHAQQQGWADTAFVGGKILKWGFLQLVCARFIGHGRYLAVEMGCLVTRVSFCKADTPPPLRN